MNAGLLRFMACGSVDDGKSTLIGHILYGAKLLLADQEQALLLESKTGRGLDFSFLLDGLMAEREQGITIDVAYRFFATEKRGFIVADTPGHEEYTRNMAVGASQTDLALLLVDAHRGVASQTRRHARICKLMGIRHFAFAVNKMDLIGYDEGKFEELKGEILELSEALGLGVPQLIPVSATVGDNVTSKSVNMPWYDGPFLLEYLENVDIGDSPENGFAMPVQRVCRPNAEFRGYQGHVESGELGVGDLVRVLPSGETAGAAEIIVAGKSETSVFAGQAATIRLDREIDCSRGCVLEKGAMLKLAKSFEAAVLCMDDEPLSAGKEYWLKLGTRLVDAAVSKILCSIDVNTGERRSVSVLGKNEIGQCKIDLSERVVADLFSNRKTLGEFILIDRVTHATSACGVIDKIWESGEKKGLGFNTRLLHFPAEAGSGATLPPIHQSSAFAYDSAEKLEKVFQGKMPGFAYTRIGNPTVATFENRIASIEGAMSAVATSSGMAAVSMALLNILQSGDELISASGLFGGTLDLFHDFEKLGIHTRYVDTVTAESVRGAFTSKTRAVFAELIGNPKLDVVDVESVGKVCSELGIPLIIDSTTATPALVRPIDLGASIVVHSSSKYISGQGNAISGVILDGGKFLWNGKFGALSEYLNFGKMAFTIRLRQDTWRNFGPCMAPENAFFGILGLETLGLRMDRICDNAAKLARSLARNPSISSVNYPTLGEYSDVSNRTLGGKGGGILTIRTGSRERAIGLINGLKIAKIATNIGDVRTLVIHPDSTIYLHCSLEGKVNAGVFDDLIRVSVGIEDPEDLIEDFRQAAEKAL